MNLCMMSLMMAGKYTPAEIVHTALDCGMSAIDWVTTHNTPAAELKKLCDDAALPVAAHTWLPFPFMEEARNAKDAFKQAVEDAHVLGAPLMMVPPFAHKRVMTLEDDRKYWIEHFNWMEEQTRQAGIILTLESTALERSPIITADEVLEVLDSVPGMLLTFDNGNVATAEDHVESYRKVKEYVAHIHLKDWSVRNTPAPGFDRKRDGRYYSLALIGRGSLDFRALWKEIKADSYDRYVNLETCDPVIPVPDALKLVCDQLRDW